MKAGFLFLVVGLFERFLHAELVWFCHAELVYATRAFALRKLFNAALACLGHQHLSNGCKGL